MAKRKRLAPPGAGFLSPSETAQPAPEGAAPETKGFPQYPQGIAPTTTRRSAPPIADVAAEAASTAALQELSDSLRQARENGRMVLELSLDQLVPDYLVRDRVAVDEDEMAALLASIRSRGQQTPIEVAALPDGRYGLISGWRRYRALCQLQAEGTGPGHVLALLRRPEQASDAYLAMVEENEIRVGLSYFERARIAAKAVEQGVYPDAQTALRSLYSSASRAKRSKIGSFLKLVSALENVLHFPEALGERAGLALVKALEADSTLPARIAADFATTPPTTPEVEQARLTALSTAPKQSLNRPETTKLPVQKLQLSDGLTLVQKGQDQLLLQGSAVDDALIRDLTAWLKARG